MSIILIALFIFGAFGTIAACVVARRVNRVDNPVTRCGEGLRPFVEACGNGKIEKMGKELYEGAKRVTPREAIDHVLSDFQKREAERRARLDEGARAEQEFVITGLDGEPIHDGDSVFVFPQRFECTLVEAGEIPIYEEYTDKPLPVADVPLARGVVYWSTDMLAYWVALNWSCPSWREGTNPCAIAMGGAGYAFQRAVEPTTT